MTIPEFDFENVSPYSIDLPPEIELSVHKLECEAKTASIEVLRQSLTDTYCAMRVQALHYDRDLKECKKTLAMQARDLAEAMAALNDRGETIASLEAENSTLKKDNAAMRMVMSIFTVEEEGGDR